MLVICCFIPVIVNYLKIGYKSILFIPLDKMGANLADNIY